MEWLMKLSNAIDYIEANLDNEISYDEVAKIACCSTYYFQRIFTYVTGISLLLKFWASEELPHISL